MIKLINAICDATDKDLEVSFTGNLPKRTIMLSVSKYGKFSNRHIQTIVSLKDYESTNPASEDCLAENIKSMIYQLSEEIE